MRQKIVMAALVLLSAHALLRVPVAHAEDAAADEHEPLGSPDWSTYLIDGGALPFFWGSLAATLTLNLAVDPPKEPRFFDSSEGGQPVRGDTVPEAAVGGYLAFGAAVMLAVPGDARWHHVKGFFEAAFTTIALTEGAKVTFGRHRPQYDPASMDVDDRQSFFSGHASITFMTSAYLGLYLHDHVFSRWRESEQAYAWWEAIPHLALAAGSVAVAASRVSDNRHHKSDVITGALVGSATTAVFYYWQQRRYQTSRDTRGGPAGASRVTLAPTFARPGIELQVRF